MAYMKSILMMLEKIKNGHAIERIFLFVREMYLQYGEAEQPQKEATTP